MVYDLDGQYAPSQYLLGNVEKVYSCSWYFEVLVNLGFVKKKTTNFRTNLSLFTIFRKKKKMKKRFFLYLKFILKRIKKLYVSASHAFGNTICLIENHCENIFSTGIINNGMVILFVMRIFRQYLM